MILSLTRFDLLLFSFFLLVLPSAGHPSVFAEWQKCSPFLSRFKNLLLAGFLIFKAACI